MNRMGKNIVTYEIEGWIPLHNNYIYYECIPYKLKE